MPRVALTPIQKEAVRLQDPILFAAITASQAWGWSLLDPWQLNYLRSTERFRIVNASRQSGKSSLFALEAYHTAVTNRDALVLIVAQQRQSDEDIRKARQIHKAYEGYLQQRHKGKIDIDLITDNKTSMEFAHGSRIISLPGNEKVRGYSAPTLVIVDEAAYLDDEVFASLEPMLEVGKGRLVLGSTPKGSGGFFHHEWKSARYQRFEVPWSMCPRISKESIDEKRLVYGDVYVKQEYECQFLEDLTSLFSESALRASLDDNEDVFTEEMTNINKVLSGDVELI